MPQRSAQRRAAWLVSPDVDARIAAALGKQRRFVLDVVAETLGEMMQRGRKALQQAISEQHELKIEVAKLSSLVAMLREELAAERGRAAVSAPADRTLVN